MTAFLYEEAEQKYPHLHTLIGGYMHQDMDLHYETCAEAVAAFAQEALPEERGGLKNDIARIVREHNQEPDAFHKYFGADIDFATCSFTFEQFVEMVLRVVDDPAAAKHYDF
ncbi:MAG: contact-dependent growth inhibition system immunity protein [Pseudomonadota bacterium]